MLDLVTVGFLVILAGFVIVLASGMRDGGGGKVKGGGVVMLGPIPIIFGSDARWTAVAVVLAIVLLGLGLLFYLV